MGTTGTGIATDLMGPGGRLCQAYVKEAYIIGKVIYSLPLLPPAF